MTQEQIDQQFIDYRADLRALIIALAKESEDAKDLAEAYRLKWLGAAHSQIYVLTLEDVREWLAELDGDEAKRLQRIAQGDEQFARMRAGEYVEVAEDELRRIAGLY